jgi:hypothetical protein
VFVPSVLRTLNKILGDGGTIEETFDAKDIAEI